MPERWIRFVAALIALVTAHATPLRACAANIEYPPFLYSGADADHPAESVGVALDVLQLALQRAGRPAATLERLPWLRCLKLAEAGDYDIVVNVPTAQIDPKPFWITDAYVDVHSVYFYSTRSRPKGIDIRNLEELKRYNLCGLMGNRYEAYGIDTARVDTGARSYAALIKKLDAGYCDLFVEKREVVDSMSSHNAELRELFHSPSLVRRDMPEDSPPGLHFAISRTLADGQTLQQSFNATIQALRNSKQLERMMQPYLQ